MRSLVVCLALGCLSLSVVAAPTFTDRGVEAGHLNPADTEIVVQTIRVAGDSTHATDFNAVQIRNGGTATYQQITRIEVRNGGTTICAMDTPIGLTSQSGVTMPTTHSLPKGDTEDISILVWIGDTDAVQGGEALEFEVRFHYLLNGVAGTSPWVADGVGEEITETGFESIDDSSPAANNFNPGDQNTVQRVSFRDEDANTSDQTVTTVLIQNTGTAAADDLASLKVTITHAGGTWQETKTTGLGAWKNGGIVFDPPDILIADGGQLTVEVDVQVADPTPAVPVDSHTMRTRTTLNTIENAQAFSQEVVATSTQRIRKGGLEEVEDDSTPPPSGVLNPDETLLQKIIVRDRDINGDRVNVTRLWVRNLGTAAETEIQWIRVKSGGATLGTFTGAQITPFLTGVWLDIVDVLVADQGDRTFFVEYKIDSSQTLKPQVRFECNEDGNVYNTATADYPEAITLYGAGLEILENQELATETVYSFQRFCAQKIRMKDIDENTNSVTVNPVVCRNRGTASDTEISKIEVRTADGALLGETNEIDGLSAGGVAIPTLSNNTVADDDEAFAWIWITLAPREDTIAGHTVELETTVFHTEGGTSYDRVVRGNSWTIALNHRPIPNFTFAKVATATVGPKADFTYKDTIQFSGTATDPDGDAISSWRWNFGDGDTSSVQNPTHKYPDGGTFTVTLTVTDGRGVTGSVTKTIEIEGPPNEPPTIDELTADPENPAVDEDVQFGATVTDPDQPAGTALGYEWDFGDETTSTDAAPTHSYAEAETYTVTLTVTDARGATDTATIEITVGNEPPTLTGVTVDPATGVGTGDEVTFTATGYSDPDDDEVDHYEWNFGDGTTLNPGGQAVPHVFTASGTYSVSVVAVDSRDAKSAAKTVTVTVTGPERTVLFAFPNPAETVATFTYFLPEGATDPILRIYNLVGELVMEEELAAGGTTFDWNLRTAGGTDMPNGLYFCVVTATGADRSEIFRLLIVR